MSPRTKAVISLWATRVEKVALTIAAAAIVALAGWGWGVQNRVTILETKIQVLDAIQATQAQDSELIHRIAGKLGVR